MKKSIYDAIKDNEIVMAEEHGGELGFSYQWKEISKKRSSIVPISNRTTNVLDKTLFLTVWGPILAALFYSKFDAFLNVIM